MGMKNGFLKTNSVVGYNNINGCDVTDLIERWRIISVNFRGNHEPPDKGRKLSNKTRIQQVSVRDNKNEGAKFCGKSTYHGI